jgi:uncharacterized protein (DUF58 family)
MQLLAKKLLDGLSSGLHKSPRKGASVLFKQHRPYIPGDEVRHLDWRVFARSDRFYIREFEQETNIRVTLLVDLSGSMNYSGTNAPYSKAAYSRNLANSLGAVFIQQQDSVGLLTFDSRIRAFLPPRARPSHLQAISNALARETPGGETSLHKVLKEAAPRFGKRGLLILISDCLDHPAELIQALAQLRQQHHEVLVFQILDRDELSFPFTGWTRFECLEAAGLHLDADAAALRGTYLENLERFQQELTAGCRRNQIELYRVVTDESLEATLSAHLSRRLKRR